jgi:hypothetical protein
MCDQIALLCLQHFPHPHPHFEVTSLQQTYKAFSLLSLINFNRRPHLHIQRPPPLPTMATLTTATRFDRGRSRGWPRWPPWSGLQGVAPTPAGEEACSSDVHFWILLPLVGQHRAAARSTHGESCQRGRGDTLTAMGDRHARCQPPSSPCSPQSPPSPCSPRPLPVSVPPAVPSPPPFVPPAAPSSPPLLPRPSFWEHAEANDRDRMWEGGDGVGVGQHSWETCSFWVKIVSLSSVHNMFLTMGMGTLLRSV